MFVETIRHAETIFDIMAAAFEEMGPYAPNLNKCLDGYYKALEDIVAAYNEDENITAFASFQNSLLGWIGGRKLKSEDFFALVNAIDKLYDYQYPFLEPFGCGFYTQAGLNSAHSRIKIFPVMKTTFTDVFCKTLRKLHLSREVKPKFSGLRPHKRYDPDSINNTLENYVIIEKNQWKWEPVMHIMTDYGRFKKCVQKRGSFHVAMFPLISLHKDLVFDLLISGTTFSITNIKPSVEDKLLSRYENAIQSFYGKDIDIAIFPEMLLTERILDHIIRKVKALDPTRMPKLIVMGTAWKNEENICVLLSDDGEIIFEQHKQTPYENGGLTENLSLNQKIVNMIEIEGIGRIFIYVCKDMDNDHLQDITKALYGDMVLLPSYSPSFDLHCSKSLAENYLCTTVMCNSCSALHTEIEKPFPHTDHIRHQKPIGYVDVPAKKKDDRDFKRFTYDIADQCLDCLHNCAGRMVQIDFAHIDEKEPFYLSPRVLVKILDET